MTISSSSALIRLGTILLGFFNHEPYFHVIHNIYLPSNAYLGMFLDSSNSFVNHIKCLNPTLGFFGILFLNLSSSLCFLLQAAF